MKKRFFNSLLLSVICIITLFACIACSNNKNYSSNDAKAFPKFNAIDYDGNKLDDSIFKKYKLTAINFWFNGCTACVNEMKDLENFSKEFEKKGGKLIGLNTEILSQNEKKFSASKKILEEQGVSYQNIIIDNASDEMQNFIVNIFAYPTTILVDSNGNIVGEPISGSLSKERLDKILEMIK